MKTNPIAQLLADLEASRKPRKAKPPYVKPDSVKQLEELEYNNRYKDSAMPEGSRFKKKYSDNTANGLQECIEQYINLNGGFARRISVTGRYIDQSKIFTNIIGQQRKVGTGKWIKSSMTKGSADVTSTININAGGRIIGLTVEWEVKIGKDRQSADQERYQENIESAGGVYFVVKSFDDFLNKYNSLL